MTHCLPTIIRNWQSLVLALINTIGNWILCFVVLFIKNTIFKTFKKKWLVCLYGKKIDNAESVAISVNFFPHLLN
jgi:hypothetical protein